MTTNQRSLLLQKKQLSWRDCGQHFIEGPAKCSLQDLQCFPKGVAADTKSSGNTPNNEVLTRQL